ncbi:hypothetical protein L873DRAFT_1186548 [Choiromyces venosus 120613-1]|uniref:Uncharacterized protein n=1 Tax=Choiromyces venosus 120613-1 TaxID=1336337 RepID=A0A3N4K3L9_9PEZI|nr:hypothetical protein L873DRAFT_1186548 [Choiromyces venosus 120613-1]
MSDKIFREVLNAIQKRSPELLIFNDVDPDDFADVLKGLRRRTNYLERRSFRIHWFAPDKILKVVMPSQLHECVAAWLFEMITAARGQGLIPQAWDETIDIKPSPTYNNFIGEYAGSVKEADLTFIPRVGPERAQKAAFPSVVLESGWSESAEQLQRDARLWQVGSGREVRVVLHAKFYQPNQQNQVRLVLSINRARPGGHPTPAILPVPVDPPPNPSISLDEFYAGDCPPTMDPATHVPLDLARLRVRAAQEIEERGNIPAE